MTLGSGKVIESQDGNRLRAHLQFEKEIKSLENPCSDNRINTVRATATCRNRYNKQGEKLASLHPRAQRPAPWTVNVLSKNRAVQ